MRLRHGLQLVAGLGERDVEHLLTASKPFDQELQAQGGLARARVSLDKMEARSRQPAAQDVIETFYARRHGVKNPMLIGYQLALRSSSERAPALSTGGEK